jgi:hypothetical protein
MVLLKKGELDITYLHYDIFINFQNRLNTRQEPLKQNLTSICNNCDTKHLHTAAKSLLD